MDDLIDKMLETLLVLIVACVLTAAVVLVLVPDVMDTISIPGDSEDQVDRTESGMSESKIYKQIDATDANLIEIETKLEYIDPDDYRNLSMVDGELKEIKIRRGSHDECIYG